MSDSGPTDGRHDVTGADAAPNAASAIADLLAEVTTQKKTFDDQTASAIGSIDGIASKAKTDASEIDNLKTAVAAIKGAVEEMQKTASADASASRQSKLDIEKLYADAKTLSETIGTDYQDITNKIAALRDRETALETVLADLETAKSEATSQRSSVEADVKTINDVKGTFQELNAATQAIHDDLKSKHESVDSQLSEITNSNQTIKEIYAALFDDTPEKKGIKSEIEDLRVRIGEVLKAVEQQRNTALSEFETFKLASATELNGLTASEQTRFSQLYEKLESTILSLLPSAGSAGLASTYYDAKSRYAVTAIHGAVGQNGEKAKISPFRHLFGHNPTSVIATGFFYTMFLGPIVIIIWLFFDLLAKMSGAHPASFSNQYLVFRALIALPLGTVSLFGYSSLRLYRRLYEEYNYKQRVMELYQSFSKEIDTKGDDDQRKALLAIMLKAVADKPSLNMHRYDGIGSDAAWKIDIGALLNRFVAPSKP